MLVHLNKTCNLVTPKTVFRNVEISYTSEVKFVGNNISNNLKWNTHIQLSCSELNKVPYMIWSLRGDLRLFMLRNIQGVSGLEDITAGGDFLGLCDQKVSYKHVSDFGPLRSYDRLKLRIEGNEY